MWGTIIRRYWLVTSLKKGPEDTPYSLLLLLIMSFLFFVIIIWQWYLADIRGKFDLVNSILAALTLLCSYFLYTFAILTIYRKTNRMLQTLTSLLASHLIIHLFAFPLLCVTPLHVKAEMNQAAVLFLGIIYLIFTLILTSWQFIVTIHIYKQAMNLENLSAILASLGLLACNILTVSIWQ